MCEAVRIREFQSLHDWSTTSALEAFASDCMQQSEVPQALKIPGKSACGFGQEIMSGKSALGVAW